MVQRHSLLPVARPNLSEYFHRELMFSERIGQVFQVIPYVLAERIKAVLLQRMKKGSAVLTAFFVRVMPGVRLSRVCFSGRNRSLLRTSLTRSSGCGQESSELHPEKDRDGQHKDE